MHLTVRLDNVPSGLNIGVSPATGIDRAERGPERVVTQQIVEMDAALERRGHRHNLTHMMR